MAKELVMPKLGLTMEKGTIVKWYLAEGDKFKKGDFLFSVETEKIINDVEAEEAGEIAEILVEEGETVPVKTLVARLVGGEEDKSDKIMAAPKARKMAAENNLKLEEIAADLNKNVINVEDIEKYLATEKEKPAGKEEKEERKAKSEKPSGMRNVIARRLTESWQAPHIYLRREIEVDKLLFLKETLREKGREISFNDLLSYVVVQALKAENNINTVSDQEGNFSPVEEINLGLAVAVEDGLLVPVIKNAGTLSLDKLAAKSKDLIKRTRENKINLDELEGGTFTITNLGMFGIDEFTAILNPPQVAILAVGTIKDKLYLDEEGLVREKKVINFTLGLDHRTVDGVTGAKFLQQLAEYIEILKIPI